MKKITYKILNTKNLPDSEVEIECEIDFEAISTLRPQAITKFQKEIKLPGFRPGHIPEAILVKHVGDLAIYTEMAELAINNAFPDIINEAKINFITMPQIQITKLADKNPVQFKIVGPIIPEIKLPDYKKIAQKENADKVESTDPTDKELEETIEEIRKNYALKNHSRPKSESGEVGKEGEEQKADEKMSTHPSEVTGDLPEVNEEWVKKLGAFTTVEDFKNKIKEGIKQEKEFKAKDKKRMTILEKIMSGTKISLPKILIENELRKMEAQFEDDITRAGLKVEDYLKHLKKTKEDLQKEWGPDAEKRALVQIIITKIALEEKITADPEQVKKEVENLLKTYKDATEERTRAYVEMMLTNEKVLAWLENQK